MPSRALPPFDELYGLIVNCGQSYTSIAKKYGVTRANVLATFKRDMTRRGHPWPIPRDPAQLRRLRSSGKQESSIDATIIRELLRDAYRKARRDAMPKPGDTVYVSQTRVDHARANRRVRPAYHRQTCTYLVAPRPLLFESALACRYRPCSYCCLLSVRRWSQNMPFTFQHVARLLSHADHPQARHVHKTTAIQLLHAIGEPPHPTLTQWAHTREETAA